MSVSQSNPYRFFPFVFFLVLFCYLFCLLGCLCFVFSFLFFSFIHSVSIPISLSLSAGGVADLTDGCLYWKHLMDFVHWFELVNKTIWPWLYYMYVLRFQQSSDTRKPKDWVREECSLNKTKNYLLKEHFSLSHMRLLLALAFFNNVELKVLKGVICNIIDYWIIFPSHQIHSGF